MTTQIKKILIANRGEIAVRIIRTCQEMGIQTVAIYSEADEKAMFVKDASEAFYIGKAPSQKSYLNLEKIIKIATKAKVDAIHPGYGFLSEKPELATACEKAGLILIGPKTFTIQAMGDKIQARQIALKANVPVVPGTEEPLKDKSLAKKIAAKMGYPVLLKAAAGGGGKGMRVVQAEKDLDEAFERASSEALQSFQDPRVYLEKYIQNPRHVEVQVLRDSHGQAFFLGERECSTQRRHQKIIEETPCCYLKDSVRQKMSAVSLSLADEVDYLGVGTIEYLVDDDQNFYFLEMNTRLQVEHTVTEEVFGIDLIRLQIRVAQQENLKELASLVAKGHAIQCRIYAEDPQNNFMPSPGKIHVYDLPSWPGIRHDTGVSQDSEITIHYDPMIAKVISFAKSRDVAIQKMTAALQHFKILGVKTNLKFLQNILESKDFKKFKIHTQFLEKQTDQFCKDQELSLPQIVKVAAALFEKQNQNPTPQADDKTSNWWQGSLEKNLS